MTAKKTKTAPAAVVPKEIVWAYGIRTWNEDGTAHGGFQWDLTPGARTEAPDFSARAVCGYGLHANKDGWGDWGLLNLREPGKVVGIVRWDTSLEVDVENGSKFKAPWMEVVMTTKTASRGSIYTFINERWREHLAAVLKAAGELTNIGTGDYGHASSTGDYGHASSTGDYGHASSTGYKGHASSTGYKGHASSTGDYAIAASLGGGSAKAGVTGAIMLSRSDWVGDKFVLVDVFAGMVGKTYGDVTIEAGVAYVLKAEGRIEAVR